MPELRGILETAIYVEDMARAVDFYERGLGMAPVLRGDRLTAFDAGRQGILLVFRRGMTEDDQPTPGGVVPGHDGTGRLHLAFAVAAEDLESWRERLARHGVDLLSEVAWPRGGTSLYFADPDGHVVELATPGLWPTY
jgi:catechol 2,3-dioxygenase-like lactoylglutathione lyase family enzyme